ncbi:hypothetical protein F66182_4570 [Fusarium sp. NRRL 66182]|nr:hypothetical protein F66182_4570 [Fusarium sp. NRRL 66182]
MNYNPSKQSSSSSSSSSSNRGMGHTDLNPARTTAPTALEVVFENPRLGKAPREPSLELPRHFTSLASDLSQETGQIERRRLQGLDNPRKIRHKLAQLKKIDLIRNPHQQIILDHWERLVIIAATIVDSHLGNKDIAASTITKLNGKELSRDTILRDKRIIREIIKLTDELYLHWKHELALELLLLLDTPLSILRQQSTQKFDKFTLLLKQCTPSTKIKSSVKLYIPFLVLFLRPEYSLAAVQKALQTSLFDKSDWDAFWKASHGPAPVYDPIRDVWVTEKPPDDLGLIEFIDYKGNYPAKLYVQISGFKVFEASLNLQEKAAQAGESQAGCTRTNSSIFAYDWSEDIHGPVMQQVMQDLAKFGVLKAQEIYVDRTSVCLSSSSTIVPSGRLQIVVPVAPSDGSLSITLSGQGFCTAVEWNMRTGYILDENTKLSTTETVKYISLLLVL